MQTRNHCFVIMNCALHARYKGKRSSNDVTCFVYIFPICLSLALASSRGIIVILSFSRNLSNHLTKWVVFSPNVIMIMTMTYMNLGSTLYVQELPTIIKRYLEIMRIRVTKELFPKCNRPPSTTSSQNSSSEYLGGKESKIQDQESLLDHWAVEIDSGNIV